MHRQKGERMQEDCLTLTEASRRLGISRWTLYRRIDDGSLPVFQSEVNRKVRLVRRSDVERMLTATPVPPEPKKGAPNQ